jgi:hypothetical protein
MQDARYFRTQAEFCLKLAIQVSDLQAAENLRAAAAKHFSRAVELEAVARRMNRGQPGEARRRDAAEEMEVPVPGNGGVISQR